MGAIEDFAQGVVDLAEPHRLGVATLNYDGLTHAGLLKHGKPADPAHGFQNHSHTVVRGRKPIDGFALRQSDDIPDDKTPLIQLHGSLGWLRHPETGSVLRFTLDDLRAIDYWSEWGAGNTNWSPVVVLTDQKERTIVRRPFALAYDIFQQRLIASDRWLIGGVRPRRRAGQRTLRNCMGNTGST